MNKLTKHLNGDISLEKNNSNINIVYKNGSIHLSKKDISELFQVKKSNIREIIDNLNIKSNDFIYNKVKGKTTKLYSLESILVIGYKLKKYNDTKLIIKTNRILKNNSNNLTILELVKNKYLEIKNKFGVFQSI